MVWWWWWWVGGGGGAVLVHANGLTSGPVAPQFDSAFVGPTLVGWGEGVVHLTVSPPITG